MINNFVSYAEAALALADISGPIVREHFRSSMVVDSKDDLSPVTAADRSVETAIRERIEENFPEHGIIGEEFGSIRENASHVWVLDPIDGTQAFIAGMPIFGTLIALAVDGFPKVGVIDQPVLNERWCGVHGISSTFNGNAVSTKNLSALNECVMYATHPKMFDSSVDKNKFTRLSSAVNRTCFGGDCYVYGLLASGFVDLVVEAKMKPYDFMALVPIVEGAGGKICDWTGKPLCLHSDGHILAASNSEVRDAALCYLGA